VPHFGRLWPLQTLAFSGPRRLPTKHLFSWQSALRALLSAAVNFELSPLALWPVRDGYCQNARGDRRHPHPRLVRKPTAGELG